MESIGKIKSIDWNDSSGRPMVSASRAEAVPGGLGAHEFRKEREHVDQWPAFSMMTLESIRESLPGYARDLQLNLGTVLTAAGAPGLTERQIWARSPRRAPRATPPSAVTCRPSPCSTWTPRT
jgi:hypothetical protein